MDIVIQIIFWGSFVWIGYLSITKGRLISRKYSNCLSKQVIYKTSFASVANHRDNKTSSGIGKVLLYENSLLLYSNFPLLFLSEELGLIREIVFDEIKTIELKKIRSFLLAKERIVLTLKNGEKYSLKVNRNKILLDLLNSKLPPLPHE